jgi:hypothetical protein
MGIRPNKDTSGTVYILHFERLIGKINHYKGWAGDLDKRLAQHAKGHGCTTTRRFFERGIGFRLGASWPGTVSDEKQLARRKLSKFCTICQKEGRMNTLEAMRQHADPDGNVTASYSNLEAWTQQSRGKCQRQLKTLITEGQVREVAKGTPTNPTKYHVVGVSRPVPSADTIRDTVRLPTIAGQVQNMGLQNTSLSIVPRYADTTLESSPNPAHITGCAVPAPNVFVPPQIPADLRFYQDFRVLMGATHAYYCQDRLAQDLRKWRGLDLTGRFIGTLTGSTIDNSQNPYGVWSVGNMQVYHIDYVDRGCSYPLHAVLFFCRGALDVHELAGGSLKGCGRNRICWTCLLLATLRKQFGSSLQLMSTTAGNFLLVEQAVYDIRKFCSFCADKDVGPGLIDEAHLIPILQAPEVHHD